MLLASVAGGLQADAVRPGGNPVVHAFPARGTIHVDGRLDEPVWHDADSIFTLTQVVPRAGVAPTARTVIRVLVQVDALGLVADVRGPSTLP